MTDLQWLAIGAPIALVVCVGAIIFVEELFNQAEMKRERAAIVNATPSKHAHSGRMTIEFSQGDLTRLARGDRSTAIASSKRSRAG